VKLALPQSLNAQFALAILALALLILAGGATAISTLSATAQATGQLADQRLARLQDAHDLLNHASLVERKTRQVMTADTADGARRIFGEIVEHLEAFDRLVDRLATASGSDNIEVLDLRRASQLLRNTANILAQVRESALKNPTLAQPEGRTDQQVMLRLHEELQGQADALAEAAGQQSTYFTRDYRDAVNRLAEQSRRMRTWVVALLVLSLLFTWLIARVFLGRHVGARLQEVSRYLRRTDDDPTPVRVPVQGADEIADMARAVEQFLDARRQLKDTERELRAARDVAVEARRAQSAFLTNMSHELRTPLNAVLGYAQLLQRDRSLSARQLAGLGTIEHSGTQLLSLINDLLDLSRIEAGKLELHRGPVELPAFINAIADAIRVKAQHKGLLFLVELADDLPEAVYTDEQRLRQVLLNLLGNAVEYTDAGTVHLRLQRLPDHAAEARLRFEVEDSGVGIAGDQLEKIFEPFEQVGDVSRRAGGSGLGLAISRQLVRMMGSDIGVESQLAEEAGVHGSKFSFELTLAVVPSRMATLPARRLVVGYEGGRKKVLVVDDVVENRSLLVDLLEPLGFDVSQAQDGRGALERAEQLRPDLILMDIVMPKMGGLEATRRLREMPALRHVPIIAVSAGAGSTDQAQSLAGGADAFLSKPIDFDQLVERIGTLLRLAWRHEQAAEAPAAASEAAGPLLPPPQEELQVLHRLARMGNMRELRERAVHIAALDPRYRLFADKLYRLADSFQSQAILGFVKEYIERG